MRSASPESKSISYRIRWTEDNLWVWPAQQKEIKIVFPFVRVCIRERQRARVSGPAFFFSWASPTRERHHNVESRCIKHGLALKGAPAAFLYVRTQTLRSAFPLNTQIPAPMMWHRNVVLVRKVVQRRVSLEGGQNPATKKKNRRHSPFSNLKWVCAVKRK